jgi:hypothetical protein
MNSWASPRAFWEQRAALANSLLYRVVSSTSPEELRIEAPKPFRFSYQPSVLTSTRLLVQLDRPKATVRDEDELWLADLDPTTGDFRWSVGLGPGSSKEGVFLSSEGTALVQGARSDGGAFLAAVAADAGVRFSCTLKTKTTSPLAIAKERLIAQIGQELDAFDLPGLYPAEGGWTAEHGSILRHGRAR